MHYFTLGHTILKECGMYAKYVMYNQIYEPCNELELALRFILVPHDV